MKWLWLAALVLLLDQASKHLADSLLVWGRPLPLAPLLNLSLAYNTGAAFSFLSDASGWQRWFFIALGLVVSALLLFWLRHLPRAERRAAAALALILGGALGNVIDRVVHGHVIDFIDIHYGAWHWPAFNVADSAITLGALLLVLDGLRRGREGA